jgi:hypothetical protein
MYMYNIHLKSAILLQPNPLSGSVPGDSAEGSLQFYWFYKVLFKDNISL